MYRSIAKQYQSHHTTTKQGLDMETIIFLSIYIVKPTLFATMIFSTIGASFVVLQSFTTTQGE